MGVPYTVPLVEPMAKPLGKAGETLHEAGVSPLVWPPKFCMVVPLVSDRDSAGNANVMPVPGIVMLTSTVNEPPELLAVMFTLLVFCSR